MKTNLLLSTVLIISALCSCSDKNEFDATGNFEATEIIVSSESNGKVLSLNVDEGVDVKAGQEVGYIDSLQLHLQKIRLISSNTSVRSRKADITKQVAAIKQQIENLLIEKRRSENLIRQNSGNKKQLDDINSQIFVFEKQLAAQQSTLERANKSISSESSAIDIQIAQIDDMINKCKISSPIDGTVLTKYTEAGEIVNAGRPIFKVADVKNLILRSYISSGQLSKIKLGQKVKIFIDIEDGGSKEYEGTLSWISEKAEFTPKTIQTKDERANLVYAVKVKVVNDGFIKIGMYGDIKFL